MAILTSAMACGTLSYAGAMGEVQVGYRTIPFVSIEGSVTWPQTSPFVYNGELGTDSRQRWGGRFAVGALIPYREKLRFSAEVGGGYYGNAKETFASTVATEHLDGYDFIGSVLYRIDPTFSPLGMHPAIDIFGGVGVMGLNNRLKVTQDISQALQGSGFSGIIKNSFNTSQLLPEIKVGGLYNVNDSLGITLAYLHVFGSLFSANSSITYTSPTTATFNGNFETQNPSLNSFMFGLRYSFV